MHRLLKPDGVFITLSLNGYGYEDIFRYYDKEEYGWAVAWVNLPNPNYDPAKENTETYTYIVCSHVHERLELQQLLERFERPKDTKARQMALEEELKTPPKSDEELYQEYVAEHGEEGLDELVANERIKAAIQ